MIYRIEYKPLVLPIKKKWFDMILAGVKYEEYREIKPYYIKRFKKFKDCDRFIVKFRNGYSNTSPSYNAEVSLSTGQGKTEWGAETGKEYYILTIHGMFDCYLCKRWID